jgi:hypothetical protein
MIPLADIDLRHEIPVKEYTDFVNHQRRARVQRIYSAKVEGRESIVTVAMYQGNGAEEVCSVLFLEMVSERFLEEWRQDIKKYMSFRPVPYSVPFPAHQFSNL